MRFLLLVVPLFAFVLFPSTSAVAGPKTKVCRPDICLDKSKLPKAYRSLIGAKSGAISTPVKIKTSATFTEFPPTNSSVLTPQMTIPANRVVIKQCLLQAGNLNCIDIVQYGTCPGNINIQDQGGAAYNCVLSCTSNNPDSNGNCDCEIVYNTCQPS